MLAYVDLVQRKEKEIGCDVLTHQKWFAFFALRRAFPLNVTMPAVGVAQTISTELFLLFHRVLQVHLLWAKILPKILSRCIDFLQCNQIYINHSRKNIS